MRVLSTALCGTIVLFLISLPFTPLALFVSSENVFVLVVLVAIMSTVLGALYCLARGISVDTVAASLSSSGTLRRGAVRALRVGYGVLALVSALVGLVFGITFILNLVQIPLIAPLVPHTYVGLFTLWIADMGVGALCLGLCGGCLMWFAITGRSARASARSR